MQNHTEELTARERDEAHLKHYEDVLVHHTRLLNFSISRKEQQEKLINRKFSWGKRSDEKKLQVLRRRATAEQEEDNSTITVQRISEKVVELKNRLNII
jgi:hypothetical protein